MTTLTQIPAPRVLAEASLTELCLIAAAQWGKETAKELLLVVGDSGASKRQVADLLRYLIPGRYTQAQIVGLSQWLLDNPEATRTELRHYLLGVKAAARAADLKTSASTPAPRRSIMEALDAFETSLAAERLARVGR